MAHDVFISYSTKDKPTADAVCATLEAHGLRCWIAPRDIRSGADWGEAIIDAISASRAVVLVFSSNANAAQEFIKREVERAVSKGIPIVPFRIEEVVPARSLEFFLGSVHWLDALTPPLEAHLTRLTEAIAALLEVDTGAGARRAGGSAAPHSGVGSAVDRDAERDAHTRAPAISDDARLRETTAQGGATSAHGRSRARLGVMLAVGVVAVAVIASLLLRSPRGGAVDPRFPGTWQTSVAKDGVRFELQLAIAPDGAYTGKTETADTGTVEARNGRWAMTSDTTHQRIDGTYRIVADGVITMTGPLGAAEWRRLEPATATRQSHDLPGSWQSRFTRDGLEWTGRLEMPPSGRPADSYRVRFTTEDSGHFFADGHGWRTVSERFPASAGTYEFLDARKVSMNGPLGVAVWNRVSQ